MARRQDHIFALRKSEGEYDTFPGALTRVSTEDSPFYLQRAWRRKQGYMGAGAADFEEPASDRTRLREVLLPSM